MIKNILNNIVMISLEGISLWTGSKKLRPEDLGNVNLPPATLASLGHKKVFDPTSLAVFSTLKRQAERVLIDVGVKFLGGYAIPEGKADVVFTELAKIETEFDIAKRRFLTEYDQKLDDWLQSAGEWSDLIRRAVESRASVSEKIKFGFVAYKIGEPENCSPAVQNRLEIQSNGLSDQLMREIAVDAKKCLEASYLGKTEVTRKALSPLKTMREKMLGLLFLNHGEISGLIDSIDAVFATIPRTGPITGAVLAGLIGCLSQLAGISEYSEAAKALQEEVDPEIEADAAIPEVSVAPVVEVEEIEEVKVIPLTEEEPPQEEWEWNW